MKIMAVDFGDARTGLAVCDRTEFLASPVGVIHEKEFYQTVNKVAAAVQEFDVKEVIVGYPKNMNGSIGERAQVCEAFAEELRNRFPACKVVLWDERLSTVAAEKVLVDADMRRNKRKKIIDMMAAVVILQNYLDSNPAH